MTGLFFSTKEKKTLPFFFISTVAGYTCFLSYLTCLHDLTYNFLPLQEIEKVVGPGGMEFIWISLLSLLLTFLLH